jgi:hypothetical protein
VTKKSASERDIDSNEKTLLSEMEQSKTQNQKQKHCCRGLFSDLFLPWLRFDGSVVTELVFECLQAPKYELFL